LIKENISNPRTLLFIPGNRPDMLKKAEGFSTQWLIPDLEDSVPDAEKETARKTVGDHLRTLHGAGKYLCPRINSLETGLTADEISALVSDHIVGISVGKISSVEDVRAIEKLIEKAESQNGVSKGSIRILPWLETAGAIVNAYEICASSARIQWAAFGAEDFSADMGISRSVDDSGDGASAALEPGLAYARSAVAVAARAAGVHILDTPHTKFRDLDSLENDAREAKALGYKGKLAIHPTQTELIETVFRPSDSEIERARAVLDAAKQAERDGKGAVALDGEMIDMPVIKRAQNVLRDAGLS
jgi:citrate lyase subunit beta/citryl-CoA lyase